MRTFKLFLMTLIAMTFLASSSALAQQGARRNTTITSRQENQAEKKQTKVDEGQKPTNVVNQPATDAKMRQAGGTQSDRRNGSGNKSGNSGNVNNNNSGNAGHNNGNVGNSNGRVNNGGNNSGSSHNNNGNVGKNNGNVGHNNGNAGHNNGNVNHNNGGNRPPVNNGHNNGYNSGYNNGYKDGYKDGNKDSHYGNGRYPGGYDYPGYRIALPKARVYERSDIVYRSNASSIVLRTYFRSKEEAYDYVAELLESKYFTINEYGNGYSWMQTDVSFVPTPYDWTNPMTHNQFRIRVNITKSFGVVRVTLSGEWRESILSSAFSILRFQPSDRYSTYYAWNILEDLADDIPHSLVSYR